MAAKVNDKPRTPAPPADTDLKDVPPVVTPGLVPMRIDNTTEPRFDQREPLVFLGDKCLTIPVEFSGAQLLEWNHIASRISMDAAIDFAFEQALGVDGYRELRQYKQLTRDQSTWIRDQILARLLNPKAKP
jgi:hypothetical protein